MDKYARMKVRVHWDRLGKKDENSSCWVRVSSKLVGPGGTITIGPSGISIESPVLVSVQGTLVKIN